MSGELQIGSFRSACRHVPLLLAVWLWAVAPAAAQTAFSWNTGTDLWDIEPGNWSPAGPPAAGDDALLGDLPVAADAEVRLVLDTPALSLLEVSGGVDLITNGFDGEAVTVDIRGANSALVVEGGSIFENMDGSTDVSNGALLLVEDGGEYRGGEVTLTSGGDVQLTGGFLEIQRSSGAGFLQINNAGELFGWGTIIFNDAGVINNDLLVNSGTIRAARPFPDLGFARHELILDTDVNETDSLVDLDGTSEAGAVSLAHNTTLTILGTLSDAFSGTIDLGPGSILNVSQSWDIDSGAVIDVDAVQVMPLIPSAFARIEGGDLFAQSGSTINVHSGTLEIDADLLALSGSLIEVMENSTLQLDGVADFNDAEGLNLDHDGTTLIVNDFTEISDVSGQFNWGGTSIVGVQVTEVNEGAQLQIDVGTFHAGLDPYRYSGTLNVNSGTVFVRVNNDDTTPWVVYGTINLANTDGQIPLIAGNQMDIGNGVITGNLNVNGTGASWISSRVAIRSASVAEIAAGAVLDLQQGVVIDGGTLELAGGEVTGDLIRNEGGTIRGNGLITSSSINNWGTIETDGGTLVIDTVNASQLDGAAPNNGQGILRAASGDLEIASNVTTVFNGLLEVGPGNSVTMSQPGSRFRNAPASEDDDGSGVFGRVELTRGTIVVTNFEQASELIATGSGRSTIDADNITFENGSLTQIVGGTDQLRLQGNTVIEAGAAFSGNGFLENNDGSSLTLEDGATLGVDLVNHGTMSIGSSPGTATVDRFIQGSGTWIVDIGGTAPGTEFDQLVVTTGVSIQGTLEVELIDLGAGLFAPSLGDTFEILVADSVVRGFETASLPVLSAGLFWQVVTQPDAVLLAVADHIAGDYNRNGEVDAADYVVWRKTLNSTSELAADGNLDGMVDNADYSIWQANFGATAENGGLAAVPEPPALVFLSIGVAGAAGFATRCKTLPVTRRKNHHRTLFLTRVTANRA